MKITYDEDGVVQTSFLLVLKRLAEYMNIPKDKTQKIEIVNKIKDCLKTWEVTGVKNKPISEEKRKKMGNLPIVSIVAPRKKKNCNQNV